jgi:glycosyltransferase involved in cell wall biosynthesis
MDSRPVIVIVSAHNEADRIEATLAALGGAFAGARIVVADDGSTDATARLAADAGAEVVSSPGNIGKGGAATLAARRLLDAAPGALIVLCDGDLAETAAQLTGLADAVTGGACDLAVGVFATRVGGGFGVAVGYARWAIRRLTGLQLEAPISGQRALRGEVLDAVVPFAPRFGMEIGMTVDAVRAGYRIGEVPLALAHRATGRSAAGFWHRARQLADFLTVTLSRSRR